MLGNSTTSSKPIWPQQLFNNEQMLYQHCDNHFRDYSTFIRNNWGEESSSWPMNFNSSDFLVLPESYREFSFNHRGYRQLGISFFIILHLAVSLHNVTNRLHNGLLMQPINPFSCTEPDPNFAEKPRYKVNCISCIQINWFLDEMESSYSSLSIETERFKSQHAALN